MGGKGYQEWKKSNKNTKYLKKLQKSISPKFFKICMSRECITLTLLITFLKICRWNKYNKYNIKGGGL